MLHQIQEKIASTPRIPFGVWPTPFMPMHGLRRELGEDCPHLWVKREDMTPYGAGGNKIRKLEYVLAKALDNGADVLLNTGEVQSNQVVQTAACAAHMGIPCELFLGRTDPPLSEDDELTGNILLCHILGARIHMVPAGLDRGEAMRQRADALRAEGKNPYIIPRGSSTVEGALGSLTCFFELIDQAREQGFTPDAIVVTVGSSGTTAGFLVGAQALARSGGPKIPIYGFDSFGKDYAIQARERIMTHAEDTWQYLGFAGDCGHDLLHLSCDFVGPHYGHPYPEVIQSIRKVAQCEGFILDPSYTGKCMTGMLDAIQRGQFTKHQNIVYMHTGGLPALFAMRRHFL